MALRDQPYLPLYIKDFQTDEKLIECSASATGVLIRLMCVLHKSEQYGTIMLTQKDKQSGKQIKNFAIKLAKHLPYTEDVILSGLTELLEIGVLKIDGDLLMQKRMVEDGLLSAKRAMSGRKGGTKKWDLAKTKNIANDVANEIASSANANANEDVIKDITVNTDYLILKPGEILKRLQEQEYQVSEFICKTYKLTETEYQATCEIFVGEKTSGKNELDKDYTEVLRQFKSWVGFHSKRLKSQLKQDNPKTDEGISSVDKYLNARSDI